MNLSKTEIITGGKKLLADMYFLTCGSDPSTMYLEFDDGDKVWLEICFEETGNDKPKPHSRFENLGDETGGPENPLKLRIVFTDFLAGLPVTSLTPQVLFQKEGKDVLARFSISKIKAEQNENHSYKVQICLYTEAD